MTAPLRHVPAYLRPRVQVEPLVAAPEGYVAILNAGSGVRVHWLDPETGMAICGWSGCGDFPQMPAMPESMICKRCSGRQQPRIPTRAQVKARMRVVPAVAP